MQRCPDITLAKDKLGWEPKINLEQGLASTISYFKELVRDVRSWVPEAVKPLNHSLKSFGLGSAAGIWHTTHPNSTERRGS